MVKGAEAATAWNSILGRTPGLTSRNLMAA